MITKELVEPAIDVSVVSGWGDVEPGKPAEGCQKVVEKYTKIVFKKLYGIDDMCVFFRDMSRTPYKAIYRNALIGLWSFLEKEQKISIIYSTKWFRSDALVDTAWETIVHEVTHYEAGAKSEIDSKEYLVTKHTEKFERLLQENLGKVKALESEFHKEVFAMMYFPSSSLRKR
jgi:hypothetical protein